jgi:dTDP-4-dehydrorhamnose 3,5-epimerase
MKIQPHNKITGLVTFEPESYYDYRGENVETFNQEVYERFVPEPFVVDSVSRSMKGVLRGFHGDKFAWKLIQCLYGSVHFVVIDVRPESPTKTYVQTFNLNDKNRLQVLVPAGCVNAHLCVSNECLFHYKLTHGYVKPEDQLHIKWNDPQFDIYWPIDNPILSQRDSV